MHVMRNLGTFNVHYCLILLYRYFIICRHLPTSSDLLFRRLDLSANAIMRLSVKHRSHLLVPHLYLDAFCSIDHFTLVRSIYSLISQFPIVFGKFCSITFAAMRKGGFVVSAPGFEVTLSESVVEFLWFGWGRYLSLIDNAFCLTVALHWAVRFVSTVTSTLWYWGFLWL